MEPIKATINVTEHQVFEIIINQAGLCKTKPPEYTACEKEFREQYHVKDNIECAAFLKATWAKFNRLKDKHKKGNAFILELAGTTQTC